ncbi:hypothetical protein TNIN_433191 [Trichonephila inaurata madagascariensis]|uniref:Secreted protein n=1 Tax=Trichonephila inaurata madagascariensis TaxID=2747483 RepID=A0A8X6IH42_9ARAC|nr:hypothetical protein TNIN_433191 [Trichonephila inaurata madagascariensis]
MNMATCHFCKYVLIIVILQFVAAEHILESDYSTVHSYSFENPREYPEDFPEYDEYDFGGNDNEYFENQPVQISLKIRIYNQEEDQDEDSCKSCPVFTSRAKGSNSPHGATARDPLQPGHSGIGSCS